MRERTPVCVFVKPPRPGEAKTRLAPAVGAEGAAMLARAFLEDTWRGVLALPWAAPILVVTKEDEALSALAGDAPVWNQGTGDLGARIERVLRRALDLGAAAIAIGADSPGLPRTHMEALRAATADDDAALGPADDGGFFAIGLRRCPEGAFNDLPWSQANTCEATAARLRSLGLRVKVTERWFDVDQPEDLRRLGRLLAAGSVSAPSTRAALADLGWLG